MGLKLLLVEGKYAEEGMIALGIRLWGFWMFRKGFERDGADLRDVEGVGLV